MSFGFSLSDIVVSYQLASEIHYRCFTKAQGAGGFTFSNFRCPTQPTHPLAPHNPS